MPPVVSRLRPRKIGVNRSKMRAHNMPISINRSAFIRIHQIMPTIKNYPVRVVQMLTQFSRRNQHPLSLIDHLSSGKHYRIQGSGRAAGPTASAAPFPPKTSLGPSARQCGVGRQSLCASVAQSPPYSLPAGRAPASVTRSAPFKSPRESPSTRYRAPSSPHRDTISDRTISALSRSIVSFRG